MIAFVSAMAWRECILYTLNYGLYLVGYEDNIMHIYKVSPRLLFGLEMRLNIFFTLSIR